MERAFPVILRSYTTCKRGVDDENKSFFDINTSLGINLTIAVKTDLYQRDFGGHLQELFLLSVTI